MDPHCLPLYLHLLNNVSKTLQQTTLAGDIFRSIFAGSLKVNPSRLIS